MVHLIKINSYIILLWIISSPWIFPLFARDNTPIYQFGLQDCIDYALKNKSEVLNQRLSQAITGKQKKQAYGQYLPQISAGTTYQYNIKRQVAVFAGNTIQIGTKDQLQAHIDIDQQIFNPVFISAIEGSRLETHLASENTKLSEIDLVVGVMKSYYGVLVSREQMTLLTDNITRSEKELEDTQIQYENGLAQKVDVDRIQVLVNNAITQKSNAERNLKSLQQSLKFYMGMPVNDSLEIIGSISEELLKPTTPVSDSMFYQNRIEYQIAQTELKISQLEKRNVTRSFLPTLSAFGSYVAPFYANTFEAMFDIPYHPTIYVGLQLSLPIFSGLSRIYQRQIADLNIRISNNNLMNLENSINLEYNTIYRLVENDLDNLKTQRENTSLAKSNYENLKYQYDNGVQPIINVLDAENTLLQAQNNYINALYQLLLDQVDLEQSLGLIKY
ncbi:MAG: TolC family protein [Calditrichota bacterium]